MNKYVKDVYENTYKQWRENKAVQDLKVKLESIISFSFAVYLFSCCFHDLGCGELVEGLEELKGIATPLKEQHRLA